ncbi:polysaccharide deacetylase family protein [Paenibacillus qinlingensis]|uniref:Peptidoglycan/xylan/chitin deacetylase (PgdA/CDA1 family) n=1 Tax=Paenibacillus qinlingensis TaxID=1837343 RepID=A0ABU1P4V4_9BACL|nr:polysaccharide deacetylase family protein [Paenibacillus qinlingensis]MDR6554785.1 peptidoglycan/xylan/chitin deacetylase (PgdA/CDA1 family) [Paenibacillus qinlingensis]
MRLQVQALNNRRLRIQFMMVVVLLVSLLVGWMPAKAAESEADPAVQEVFGQLQAGKRLKSDRTYVTPEQPTVYLTFDDGPSKLTNQVLDILDKEDVKATFFVLGEQAKAHPNELKRIVKDGHAIGNHTYNHVYKELYSDFQTFWNQIQRSEDVISSIVGIRPQLTRAPGGTATNFDANYFYLMEQAGYIVHDWNVDSGDSKRANVPVNEIWQTVKASPLDHEINILFHDGTGHESSVQVLPQVISYYKKLGYTFAALTEQVKPKQFAISKPKWSRSMSLPRFQALLDQTQEYATAHPNAANVAKIAEEKRLAQKLEAEEEAKAKAKKEEEEEAARILAQQAALPLQVHVLGGNTFNIEPSVYKLRANQIELPLRYLIEKMGGKVEWQASTKTANAHYGIYDMDYDLTNRSIRLYTLGTQTATYSLADMDMQNNQIIVPLRKTIDSLGGRITNAVMAGDNRQVTMALRPLYFFKENNSILKNSLFAMGG